MHTEKREKGEKGWKYKQRADGKEEVEEANEERAKKE